MMKTTSLTSIVMGGRREEGLGWRVMGWDGMGGSKDVLGENM
jgi:hypothetical protein